MGLSCLAVGKRNARRRGCRESAIKKGEKRARSKKNKEAAGRSYTRHSAARSAGGHRTHTPSRRKRRARSSLFLVGKVRKYAFGAHGYIGARAASTTMTATRREGGKPGLYICVLKGIPEYILHMLYCRLISNSIPRLAPGPQERTFFEPRSHSLSLFRFFERS